MEHICLTLSCSDRYEEGNKNIFLYLYIYMDCMISDSKNTPHMLNFKVSSFFVTDSVNCRDRID